ncbi:uncharacterized protein JN550_005273 [Neoarthrinium moseri]|uniref:uncharacterized protein n=1 Tax=Neoarthrinium moseri TaxID=1658444 RepID=UPI001FDD71C9|nr:uncharacterized protein JN550_005273 [Neoarthrinium moseri]KAI1870345.1 hypothetical protein JN550_005273 [Neoarthrinium moseri]
MQEQFVADIQTDSRQHATVRFTSLTAPEISSAYSSHNILGLLSVAGDPFGTSPLAHQVAPTRNAAHTSALSKSRKIAIKVERLLNGVCHLDSQSPEWGLPYLRICNDAVVMSIPCDDSARSRDGTVAFHKLKTRFPNTSRTDNGPGDAHSYYLSTQNLHFSCPNVTADAALFDCNTQPMFEDITVLSGMCLFSDKVMQSSIISNRPNGMKLLNIKPTLYEMEYIARISPVTADIAALLASRYHHTPDHPIRVSLDVPTWQYYASIHPYILRGDCTFEDAYQWLEAVERRSYQASKVFEKAVRYELNLRGYPLEILISPGTKLVSETIKSALRSSRVPCLAEALASLVEDDTGLWARFWALLPEKERPRDFKDLGYLFYVLQAVRPALGIPINGKGNGRHKEPNEHFKRLIISVDDRSERKIYSKAQSVLKAMRRLVPEYPHATLIEAYVARRIFIDGNKEGSTPYWSDPGPDGILLHEGQDQPYDTGVVMPADIVGRLYGEERSDRIYHWFTEVDSLRVLDSA